MLECGVGMSDPCPCEFFDDDPAAHAELIAIESMDPVEAATLVAKIIGDDDLGTGAAKALFGDVHDFGRFVSQHHWQDRMAMFKLGQCVDWAAEQAGSGRWQRDRARIGGSAA